MYVRRGTHTQYRIVSYIQQRRGGPKSTRPCFVFRSHHPWAWNSKKKVRRNGMDEGGDGHTANGYKFPCGMSPVQNRLAPVNGGTMSVIVSTYTEQLSRPHPPSRPLHEQVFFPFCRPWMYVCVLYTVSRCAVLYGAHTLYLCGVSLSFESKAFIHGISTGCAVLPSRTIYGH